LWAVLISLPVILWTLFSRSDLLFWRVIYVGLVIGLIIVGGALLNPNIPLRWIERFTVLLTAAFGFSKYTYLVYGSEVRQLINWLIEIQATFWVIAIGFLATYIVFDRKKALWICLGQVAVIFLVTLPHLEFFSSEIRHEFLRLETRLVAVAFITLILAKAKDDLLETQNRALDVETLAYLDALTGLPNRRAVSQMIEKRMAETKPEMGLVVADIDFFKSINDTYGHDIGDRVLREVASLLKSSLRERDLVGRWGGEEFIILLHEGNVIKHMQTIERIRRLFENTAIANGLHITLSFGGSDWQTGDTLEKLFARADQALYVAKSKGRNRVEWV